MITDSVSPIRIVIADDHELLRDGFACMIRGTEGMELIGEAANGRELVNLVKRTKPNVVIADIEMPVMDGISATRVILEAFPDMGVIGLTMHADDCMVVQMLEAGAKGYLQKNSSKQQLLEAITAVYNNEIYYCRRTSQRITSLVARSKFNPHKKTLIPEFTIREMEVIRLICQQKSNKEISEALDISTRTVEGARLRIQRKMKVKNAAGVALYAVQKGLYQMEVVN